MRRRFRNPTRKVVVILALLGFASLSACVAAPGILSGIGFIVVVGAGLFLGTTQSGCDDTDVHACLSQVPNDMNVHPCLSPPYDRDMEPSELDMSLHPCLSQVPGDMGSDAHQLREKDPARERALANLEERLPPDVVARLRKKSDV